MEKKIVKTYCNICEKELIDNGIRTNCNKFEEPFIIINNENHLCFQCAGKLLYLNFLNSTNNKKIKDEELIKLIAKTKEKINPSNHQELIISNLIENETL
jgi:hypothetical protein